jgi:TolA-binding protein
MSVVDLHPEDLLDKDAHGTLEEGERARLDAHVAHCSACRFERQLRADFAVDLEGDWPLERLGSLGLLAIEALPAAPKTEPRLAARPIRRRRTKLVWLFAAAVLLVGGAAAAMNGLGEGPWSRFMVRPAPAAPPVLGTTEAPRPKVHKTVAIVQPEPSAPLAPLAESVTPPAAVRAVHVAAPAPARTLGAAELFDAATDARRRGDYGRVLDVDHELETRFPTSREAQVLRAIIGRALLDRGDATGALARFDGYLAAGGGDLAEDAMVGRATALDRLGRSDEAARAWAALLATFPATPYAAHAKARLETLTGH